MVTNDVQMRSLIKGIIPEGRVRPGAIFWTSHARAKEYIDAKVAEPIGAGTSRDPVEKKSISSVGDPSGRSTDSVKSAAAGQEQPSAASPLGRVLRSARSLASPKRTKPAASKS